MSEPVTLEQLAAGGLQSVEVYLARFGGTVALRELTGAQVLKAVKLGTHELAGTDGIRIPDGGRQKALMVAFALQSPSLGETDEERALRVDVVEGLPYTAQLLLYSLVTMMTDEELTEEHREALLREVPETEHLAALNVQGDPAALLGALGDEQASDVLRVGLRIPAALDGGLPMSTVRRLAEELTAEREELAAAIAARLSSGP